jgi:hypothetical protein
LEPPIRIAQRIHAISSRRAAVSSSSLTHDLAPDLLRVSCGAPLWQEKIEANIKRPTNAHEEAVHAQIRDRLFNMKDGRMTWLEKNIDDTLIGAILTAPAYVSGLTDAEYQFVKLQLERHAPAEIIEA